MKCNKCGNEIAENEKICSACGTPAESERQRYWEYVDEENDTIVRISENQLIQNIQNGTVFADTFICSEGSNNWISVSESIFSGYIPWLTEYNNLEYRSLKIREYEILKKVSSYMSDFLNMLKQEYSKEEFDFTVTEPIVKPEESYIEFTGYEKTGQCRMLVVYCHSELEQLCIPNIFIPYTMRHHNIGKTMIGIIRYVAEDLGYRLYIVDMVDSFYNSMLKRGALPCKGYDDELRIDEYTDLKSHY